MSHGYTICFLVFVLYFNTISQLNQFSEVNSLYFINLLSIYSIFSNLCFQPWQPMSNPWVHPIVTPRATPNTPTRYPIQKVSARGITNQRSTRVALTWINAPLIVPPADHRLVKPVGIRVKASFLANNRDWGLFEIVREPAAWWYRAKAWYPTFRSFGRIWLTVW